MAFTEFGDYLQYLKFDSVIIDNNVFRLHYKITCMIFLCSSALTLMGDYIGDPIDCMVDGIPSDLMDTYCWIHSTFSVPSRCVNFSILYLIHIYLLHLFWFSLSETWKYFLQFLLCLQLGIFVLFYNLNLQSIKCTNLADKLFKFWS